MTGEDILDALLRELLVEGWAVPDTAAPGAAASKRHFLRTLMNIRPFLPARLGDHTAKDPSKTSIVLRGHEGRIYAVAIGPDNHYLVTGSDDHIARLWTLRLDDLFDRACRAAGRNLTREEWAQYVPAGRYYKTFRDLP